MQKRSLPRIRCDTLDPALPTSSEDADDNRIEATLTGSMNTSERSKGENLGMVPATLNPETVDFGRLIEQSMRDRSLEKSHGSVTNNTEQCDSCILGVHIFLNFRCKCKSMDQSFPQHYQVTYTPRASNPVQARRCAQNVAH